MRKIKTKTRTGLLLAGLIFLAIGLGTLAATQRLIADARLVSHTNQVIGSLDELEARVRDAESALRGYLLTGQVDYLADYRLSREQVPGAMENTSRLVADNREQSDRMQGLQALVQQRLHQMASTLQRYRRDALAGARAATDSEVLETSSSIRSAKARMVDVEQTLLAQRAASTAASANVLRAIALMGIPLGLMVIFAVYRLLVAEIRRRAEAEEDAVEVHARLREGMAELEHKSADLRALSRYGSMLQSCVTVEEALKLSARMLATLRPGAAGTLYLMRNSQDHAEAALHWGTQGAASADALAPDTCWALRRDQPYLTEDAAGLHCPHIAAPVKAGVATACIPLSAQGVQLGLLYLSEADASFLQRVDIIESVAEQLSMALANLSLQERLRLQSIRDPLTGLFNRRYLEESAVRELSRCARRELPLALLMLDIDHFKAFNDVHGHAGGDAVLAEFGKLLTELSRGEDIACRYGGEEFTLILPEAPLEAAMARAEAIRRAVEAMRVRHLGRELPQVTVSIGVAGFPQHGNVPAALLQLADEALYRAKRAGRNRVECAAG